MNLLDLVQQAGGGNAIGSIAKQLGIPPELANQVVGQLVPNLAQGMQNNAQQPGGLDTLTRALQGGKHQRYAEEPDVLTQDDTIADGNNILGHIFGSKDVSRQVAGRAAERTGVDSSIIKKMLPMVAALAMGAMSKSQAAPRSPNAQLQEQEQDGGIGGLLSSVLDSNNDGSIADDLIGLAGRFLSR